MTPRDPNTPVDRPDRASRRPRPPQPTPRPPSEANPSEHEGAAETEVGDRTGPGAGFDDEPEQEQDRGGVS